MRRVLAFLGFGTLLGAAALYFAAGRDAAVDASPPQTRAVDPAAQPGAAPRASSTATLHTRLVAAIGGAFGEREREAVDAIAAGASAAELAELARLVAGLPNLPGRGYALEALLRRYVRLDPPAAVALAGDLRAANDLLTALHLAWADVDSGAALLAAGARGEPVFSNVAMAILGLQGALHEAALLPDKRRIEATARIAAIAVREDPYEALAQAVEIVSDDARAAYIAAVFRDWAIRDPEAMLRYTLDLGPSAQRVALEAGGIEAFAQLDTFRALEIVGQLDGSGSTGARTMALLDIAREQPLAVVRLAESMPPGRARDQVLGIAAVGYAELDPEGALAWVQSLDPPVPGMFASVLAAMARRDPSRLIDVLVSGVGVGPQNERWRLMEALVSSDAATAAQIASVASRLSAADRRNELTALSNAWARARPTELLDWLAASGERASAQVYAQAAESLGRTDPAAAAAYLQRVPQDMRATWIAAAAEGYARADAPAAARWVERYAGEEGYDTAVAGVAASTALRDPRAAARVLDRLDLAAGGPGVDAARLIAAQWLRRDARAARDWALDLPQGAARDAALGPLVSGAAVDSGVANPELLAAFSSDAAAQRALRDAVAALAVRDAGAARRLADHITDPALRREAERALDRP